MVDGPRFHRDIDCLRFEEQRIKTDLWHIEFLEYVDI